MKNKKLAAWVSIPLALSFSLGISACSAPANPADAKVSQSEQLSNEQISANITSTVGTLRDIVNKPEHKESIVQLLSDELPNYESFDADDKIWNQIQPLAGFATDDKSLSDIVLDSEGNPTNAKMVKAQIIGVIAMMSYDTEGNDTTDYSYEYSSLKTLKNGNLEPQSQTLVKKNDKGVIIDAIPLVLDFTFSKDGTKFNYDFKTNQESGVASSVQSDAINAAKEIETYLVEHWENLEKEEIEKFAKTINLSEGNVLKFEFKKDDSSYKIFVSSGTNPTHKAVYDSAQGGLQEVSVEIAEVENKIVEVFALVQGLDPESFIQEQAENATSNSTEVNEIDKAIANGKITEDKRAITVKIEDKEYTFAFIQETDGDDIESPAMTDTQKVTEKIEEYFVLKGAGSEGAEKITQADIETHIKENVELASGTVMNLKYNEKDVTYVLTLTNGDEEITYDSVTGMQ